MMGDWRLVIVVGAIGTWIAPAMAQESTRTIAKLLDCRAMTGDAERLQCYDQAAVKLAAVQQSGELVTLDRSKLAKAKRQKFGLPVTRARTPPTPEGEQLSELRQIDSTITGVRPSSYGRYVLLLANNGIWETAEPLSFPPTAGASIKIVRAGFGGFRATAGKGRSFLVKRMR